MAARARAQQPGMSVIGLLDSRSPDAMSDRLRAFRQGLKDAGYVEGENVAIIYRFAENQMDQLPELAAELVRRQVAVIATTVSTGTFAAKAATTTIPIVFLVGEDPVRLGLVASLARPSGNLTGINLFTAELTAKRLELLRELVPQAARVAVPITEATLRDAEAAARAVGLQIQVLNANTSREIDAAFETMARERPDALFVATSPFFIYSFRGRPVRRNPGRSAGVRGGGARRRSRRRRRDRACHHRIRALLEWRPDRDGRSLDGGSSRSDYRACCTPPIARGLPLPILCGQQWPNLLWA
jgi:ABC-type uncharacterized transport system substrate-binding protein